jgi:hypothetical protein
VFVPIFLRGTEIGIFTGANGLHSVPLWKLDLCDGVKCKTNILDRFNPNDVKFLTKRWYI